MERFSLVPSIITGPPAHPVEAEVLLCRNGEITERTWAGSARCRDQRQDHVLEHLPDEGPVDWLAGHQAQEVQAEQESLGSKVPAAAAEGL